MYASSKAEAKARGLRVYLTGKPCTNGHTSARRVSGACVDCEKMFTARWAANNPGKHQVAVRNWELANSARKAQTGAEWVRANKERKAAAVAAYEKANKDRLLAYRSAWVKANPGRASGYAARRRTARRNAVPAWANLEAIDAIYQEARRAGLTVDHIVPLLGDEVCGLHVENNLQLLSRAENSVKSNKFTETWP